MSAEFHLQGPAQAAYVTAISEYARNPSAETKAARDQALIESSKSWKIR